MLNLQAFSEETGSGVDNQNEDESSYSMLDARSNEEVHNHVNGLSHDDGNYEQATLDSPKNYDGDDDEGNYERLTIDHTSGEVNGVEPAEAVVDNNDAEDDYCILSNGPVVADAPNVQNSDYDVVTATPREEKMAEEEENNYEALQTVTHVEPEAQQNDYEMMAPVEVVATEPEVLEAKEEPVVENEAVNEEFAKEFENEPEQVAEAEEVVNTTDETDQDASQVINLLIFVN